MQRILLAGLWLGGMALGMAQTREPDPVYLGLDLAYSLKSNTAPQAIEWGAQAAIAEINARGGVLGGRPLQLIITDNQGLPARGRDNFIQLAGQRDLIAVLGGKFSPVTMEAAPEAQRLRVPLISVWGSADPITDHGHQPSYVLRLALKDSWALDAMLQRARQRLQARRVCAVLPRTAWGRSGHAVIDARAPAHGQQVVLTRWYEWGQTRFEEVLQACRAAQAQALILVANEREAAVLVSQMARLPQTQRLPIVAHWGLSGGAIHELAGAALDQVDMQVIQTFSFIGNPRPAARRLAQFILRQTSLEEVQDIPSPVGAAHAYDMTHLLALAVNRAGSTRGEAVREALVKLPPFEGAVRRYAPAFTATRHDALTPQEVLFVRVQRSGVLMPIP